MRLEGFVTVGRGELLLTLIAVALLMAVLGYAVGQIVLMARRPEPVKLRPITPADEERGRKMLRQLCTGPHCDDEKQMDAWLRSKDFSLITNEMLHEFKVPGGRLSMPGPITPAQQQKMTEAFGPRSQPQWPGGDPDGV